MGTGDRPSRVSCGGALAAPASPPIAERSSHAIYIYIYICICTSLSLFLSPSISLSLSLYTYICYTHSSHAPPVNRVGQRR